MAESTELERTRRREANNLMELKKKISLTPSLTGPGRNTVAGSRLMANVSLVVQKHIGSPKKGKNEETNSNDRTYAN